MTIDDVIAMIDQALDPVGLSDLQESILRQAWGGKTYQLIADDWGYDPDYVRKVGQLLWGRLSEIFGVRVTKANFRGVLQRHYQRWLQSGTIATPDQSLAVVSPEGPVELNSPFYIARPPNETWCYDEIVKPGALIRLRAPRQMGKTSLKNRILAHAEAQGYHTVRLSMEQADLTQLSHVNRFLRWFCANITQQLQLEPALDQYWDDDIGAKVSCTLYLQAHILTALETPLVLAIDEVNVLFDYPEVAQSFLPLLRSWYEEAKDSPIWQKLRFIVAHSTEVYVPLNVHQSPFNVGLALTLPEFTPEQVQTLAQRHDLTWSTEAESQALIRCVGGHPYRVRLALYHLKWRGLALDDLLQKAPTMSGIYQAYLRQHWAVLQEHPTLRTALQAMLQSQDEVQPDPVTTYKLESLGLVKRVGDRVVISCELYRHYFQSQLASDN